MLTRIAITPGEPAGIGPDLCIALAQNPPANMQIVVVADGNMMRQRADHLGSTLTLLPFEDHQGATRPGELCCHQVDLVADVTPGNLNSANSAYVLECLRQASDLTRSGQVEALVTGPVHKGIINDAGFSFSGHTEFLADYCDSKLTVMMLATEGLRVALATTHIPLVEVPGAITRDSLREVIEILNEDLVSKFGIVTPRILVCGLNPHAGENGHLGREEIEVIEPVLAELRSKGLQLTGPLPADTLFTAKYLDECDAVLSMYHDQGLPVLKFKGFGNASNITLGLPIIRTSVDHGTAIDLAGTGKVDTGSLYNAINTAVSMTQHFQGEPST